MTNKKYVLATILALAMAQTAFAAEQNNSPVDVSVDARVRYEATKYSGDDTIYSDLNAEDVEITMTAQLSDKIRAKIRADLAPLFAAGDASDKLEAAIEEATIEIREINGLPVAAVIFGKQKVAFGNVDSNLPGYKDSLLYELMHKDEVIGVTVQLKDVLGFAIAASAFENSEGDLRFGEGWGFSVEASRQLTQNVKARASFLASQRGSESDMGDKRATAGLVYENDDGSWSAHLDGIWFDGQSCSLSDKHFGIEAGASAQAGMGRVRVSAAYLERTAYEVAAAYDIPVTENLVISPAVRYTTDENGENGETRAMVEARVRTGSAPKQVK